MLSFSTSLKILLLCRGLTLYHAVQSFNDPTERARENLVRKAENASNQHVLLILHFFFFMLLQTLPQLEQRCLQMLSFLISLKCCRFVCRAKLIFFYTLQNEYLGVQLNQVICLSVCLCTNASNFVS